MSYQTLIPPAELARHLEQPEWVVVDCRFNLMAPDEGREQYRHGHLPGARYAHLEADLSGPVTTASGRHPLPEPQQLAERLGRWGIGHNTQVVAYDDAGGAVAARLWWLLRWLGHERVAVLDGGMRAWVAAGLPLSEREAEVVARNFEGTPRAEQVVSTDEVLANLVEERFLLVDARTPERYRGEQEPIDPVAGRVPGAFNRPLQTNLDEQGAFRPAQALREQWLALLGHWRPEQAVHMCGSGITACHNLLAMEVAGLTGARLYAGSWSEWIRDRQRPIATTGP